MGHSASLFILVSLSWLKALLCALDCRYHDGDAYIIDVSQSVEHDHPHALEFLRKDCSNVNGECDENIYWLLCKKKKEIQMYIKRINLS